MAKYLWYSGATDTTGMALAEALGLTATKTRPRNLAAGDLIVGWGAKVSESINIPNGVTIWNSPNDIRENRNKFTSLQKMVGNAQLTGNIAKFCNAGSILRSIERNTMKYPVIGRTNYHQGGKGFWLCLSANHINLAIADGAQYFQEFIDIATEYRLHVLFDEVVYAVRKTANTEENSWIAHQKERVEESAKKNNWELNADTINRVLGVLSKQVQLPDYIIRSNKRGWKFSSIRLDRLDAALRTAALRAVATVGLQFGAVDCALDTKGNVSIIEINSGPGLQGTAKDKYFEVFRAKIQEFDAPKKKAAAQKAPAVAGKAARAVGAAAATPVMVSDDEALALLKVAETDEDRKNVLRLLRTRG